jgi:hypothetical protein
MSYVTATCRADSVEVPQIVTRRSRQNCVLCTDAVGGAWVHHVVVLESDNRYPLCNSIERYDGEEARMNRRATHRRTISTFALLAMLLLASPAALARSLNPGVVDPNDDAYGKSYEEWSAAWWQWVFSLPGADHPLFDQTGADCDKGQKGKVWFLAGLFTKAGDTSEPGAVTRSCTIPTGKAIFFPVLNGWWDNVEVIPPLKLKELKQNCESLVRDPQLLSVTLDGQPLTRLERYKIRPTRFSYDMPPHGFFEVAFGLQDFSGGPPPPGAVTCGYYLLLNPLSKGHHDLHIQTTNADGNSTQDVTYDLTIGK